MDKSCTTWWQCAFKINEGAQGFRQASCVGVCKQLCGISLILHGVCNIIGLTSLMSVGFLFGIQASPNAFLCNVLDLEFSRHWQEKVVHVGHNNCPSSSLWLLVMPVAVVYSLFAAMVCSVVNSADGKQMKVWRNWRGGRSASTSWVHTANNSFLLLMSWQAQCGRRRWPN